MLPRTFLDLPRRYESTPFGELARMRNELDRLFSGWGQAGAQAGAGVFPLINITEDADAYRVRAELPGIQADALDITVTGKSLSISGERRIAEEDKNAKYHRREREAGAFRRMISLPGPIDNGKVSATSSDGVLTILLPKAEEAKPRQITVK